MKSLRDTILESLESEELDFKLSSWMKNDDSLNELWDDACRSWKETRQIDDDAVQRFINGCSDIKGFISFMQAEKDYDVSNMDSMETIKKIIKTVNK